MRALMHFIVFISVALFSIPQAVGDGGLLIYDRDMWGMFDQGKQFAAINYKNGRQKMIITIETAEELEGKEAVWIFPIPAQPEKANIDIIQGFPSLQGYDVRSKALLSLESGFLMMRLTQLSIMALPVSIPLMLRGLPAKGVSIHKRIEKMGLTSELVSALNVESFSAYLKEKKLELPVNFKTIIDDYIGQEYTFVIAWISDVERFKQEQRGRDSAEGEVNKLGNMIGIEIAFPADKLYYPLKLTSVYGNIEVPVAIYVTDYVTPQIYPEIETSTRIRYFYQREYRPPENLRDFFYGREQFDGFRYTKIEIDAPAKHLTQDLWMDFLYPDNVKKAEFYLQYASGLRLIMFMGIPGLASMLAGLIIFRKDRPSLSRFFVLGLSNLATITGFVLTANKYISGTSFTKTEQLAQEKLPQDHILKRSLLLNLIFPALFLILTLVREPSSFRSLSAFMETAVAYPILYLLGYVWLAPFVWSFYRNRRVFKFNVLFVFVFLALTVVFESACKALLL